jgi:hypothetical protein
MQYYRYATGREVWSRPTYGRQEKYVPGRSDSERVFTSCLRFGDAPYLDRYRRWVEGSCLFRLWYWREYKLFKPETIPP